MTSSPLSLIKELYPLKTSLKSQHCLFFQDVEAEGRFQSPPGFPQTEHPAVMKPTPASFTLPSPLSASCNSTGSSPACLGALFLPAFVQSQDFPRSLPKVEILFIFLIETGSFEPEAKNHPQLILSKRARITVSYLTSGGYLADVQVPG